MALALFPRRGTGLLLCPVRAAREQRQNLGTSEAARQKLLQRQVPNEVAGRLNSEGDLAGFLGCSLENREEGAQVFIRASSSLWAAFGGGGCMLR